MNASTPEAQALMREQTEVFVRLCNVTSNATWTMIDNAPTQKLRTQAYEIHCLINRLALEAMGSK